LRFSLCCDRRSVGQSVLVSSTCLSDNCGFLHVGSPLSREDEYVIYSCSCFGASLLTIYCSLILASPNLECQVPVFLSPRNRVAHLYARAQASLYVASYDSQGYGGGILTLLETGTQPGGLGPRIYIPQEQGSPVIPPGTDFQVPVFISPRNKVAQLYPRAQNSRSPYYYALGTR
jgi:hypothetical protein